MTQPLDKRLVTEQSLLDGPASSIVQDLLGDVGPGILAYAKNETGRPLLLTGSPFFNDYSSIVVPATNRDVWIDWSVTLSVTVGGQGIVIGAIYDITGAGAVLMGAVQTQFLTAQPNAINAGTQQGSVRVGPSDHARNFVLYGWTIQSGSDLEAAFANSGAWPTWIRAVAL